MLVWNERTSSKDNAETHTFRVLQHTELQAKVAAFSKAREKFPPNDGWAYDLDNATVRELSRDEVWGIIEEHRGQAMKEGEEKVDESLAELEKIGVVLNKPELE
jgi:hypothetical protein